MQRIIIILMPIESETPQVLLTLRRVQCIWQIFVVVFLVCFLIDDTETAIRLSTFLKYIVESVSEVLTKFNGWSSFLFLYLWDTLRPFLYYVTSTIWKLNKR